MLRLPKMLAVVVAGSALVGGGYLWGQYDSVQPARAGDGFYTDYCDVRTRTEFLGDGNSATVATVVMAKWNTFTRRWESLYSFEARSAMKYDCN